MPTIYDVKVNASDGTAVLQGAAHGISLPYTIQYGANRDAGFVDGPFDYYTLFSAPRPSLDPRAACSTPCADATSPDP